MKCRSVACIWSGSPPIHRVTATAVLNHPPTLYTGGSDGSILWWNLSADHSNHEIKPIAMLCGHASPIADLGTCLPVVVDDSNDVALNSNSADSGALVSACTDGVLCVWSRSSGHCRRRRKMPPWVGSPSMIRTIPENPRYVSVACCFVDTHQIIDHQLLDPMEVVEVSIGRDSQYRKPSKCTVVIVDSYTLSIVQTVFHGNLSIGPLKFMAVVLAVEDMEKQLIVMVDSFGKLQCVPILKDSNPDEENGTFLQKNSSHLEMINQVDGSSEGGHVVTFAIHGQILALVYNTHCIFRLVPSCSTIGKVSFLDKHLCLEGFLTQSHVVGGMFLQTDDVWTINTWESPCKFPESFAAWNTRGSAVIYRISYSDDVFKSEPVSVIPAVAHPLDLRLSICFIQLKSYLLRIESLCFDAEEPWLWKPRVTIWLLSQQHDNNERVYQECKMHGEGSVFFDWIARSTSHRTKSLRHNNKPEHTDSCAHDAEYDLFQKDRFVSSSMVISGSYYTPYAVVYGFYTGEIEVVRFHIFFEGLGSHNGSPLHEVDSNVSKQYFLGHTGAVLCLATHRMLGSSKGQSLKHVLVSGSVDCTVRIWNLDSGDLITVMHQHVSPVRQLILPPLLTDYPWRNCFLSIGDDSCVALTSFETLRVERMFPGHPFYPAKVVWDVIRGYIACLCPHHSGTSDVLDVLYIWDVKTGARERVLRGTASHAMFDHFCKGTINSLSDDVLNGNTSASSLLLPVIEDTNLTQPHLKNTGKGVSSSHMSLNMTNMTETRGNSVTLFSPTSSVLQSNKHPIKCSCPIPGIATLSFDLASLMSPCQTQKVFNIGSEKGKNTFVNARGAEIPKDGAAEREKTLVKEHGSEMPSSHHVTENMHKDDSSDIHEVSSDAIDHEWVQSLEGCLIEFSLSFLHLWDVDCELDKLLITDMKIKRPENFFIGSGLQGDRGSLTLTFPSLSSSLELWKLSSEFCAMRSLTMVSLAQRMISLSHSCSAASSALAAFYTRNFAEKVPDIKPPLLQLLVSFWQDERQHVQMAARSLFHCAASRAIPLPLCSKKTNDSTELLGSSNEIGENEHESADILAWLESFEVQDWISCVGGTSQDAMTSHIIVAAALATWYPSLVKPNLAMLAAHPLIKLAMSMNEKYSSSAAELLAEGMESTWKAFIGSEIPRLIGDILFQVECVSANSSAQNPAVSHNIQESLAGILLPSLSMADIPGFLNVIESQVWSTASDSPVHVVALMTLIRVVRGSPRNLAQYLDKAVSFILQTMDPGNSVMRKTCFQSAMTALKEVVRAFPMVTLNDVSTRLAIGDAVGEINNASIRVYDMQSVAKIKVLDASGPPGLPSLLAGDSEMLVVNAISALSFSPDGEGLVAFSEHGLMIRWWSLGSVWWEKLSRNLAPVQCTKLIFVPPLEGFSPNSTRSSIMASITGHDGQANSQESTSGLSEMDRLKLLIHNLDLSYRLEWVGERKLVLTRHGHELGTFPL